MRAATDCVGLVYGRIQSWLLHLSCFCRYVENVSVIFSESEQYEIYGESATLNILADMALFLCNRSNVKKVRV